MSRKILGRTVALTLCPALGEAEAVRQRPTTISGLYDIEEYFGTEPANYVWSPYYLVYPHGVDDGPCFEVNADVLEAQVDPSGYGRQLAEERWMELAQEDEYRSAGELQTYDGDTPSDTLSPCWGMR